MLLLSSCTEFSCRLNLSTLSPPHPTIHNSLSHQLWERELWMLFLDGRGNVKQLHVYMYEAFWIKESVLHPHIWCNQLDELFVLYWAWFIRDLCIWGYYHTYGTYFFMNTATYTFTCSVSIQLFNNLLRATLHEKLWCYRSKCCCSKTAVCRARTFRTFMFGKIITFLFMYSQYSVLKIGKVYVKWRCKRLKH